MRSKTITMIRNTTTTSHNHHHRQQIDYMVTNVVTPTPYAQCQHPRRWGRLQSWIRHLGQEECPLPVSAQVGPLRLEREWAEYHRLEKFPRPAPEGAYLHLPQEKDVSPRLPRVGREEFRLPLRPRLPRIDGVLRRLRLF
jgi:hypothetical protein